MGKNSKKNTRPGAKSAPPQQADLAARLLSTRPLTRADLRSVGVLVLLALAARLAFFFINRASNPLFDVLVLDAAFHNQWANDIIHTNFWGDEVYFRAPLYAYFLAALHRLSGSSVAFAIFVQHLLGVGTVILTYVLARRYFAPKVAMIAGLLCSLYWPLIYFEGDLLIVTLFIAIVMSLLLTLSIAIDRRSSLWFIASGALLGLAATTRPSILALAPALPFVFHASSRAKENRWLRPTVLVAVAAVIVISPVMIRNYVVGRDFVPIASQGGVNFYIGNNAQSNGTQAVVPGARADLEGTYRGAIAQAEQEVGRPLKPSQVQNHFLVKGLEFVFLSPGEAAVLTGKKFYYFWGAVERGNNKYIQFFWRKYGLGRVPLPGLGLVGPLALLGGFLLWRRRRELSLLYLFVATYMVGVVVFFVNARFRLPAMPVLIIFAAYAAAYLYAAFRRKRAAMFPAIGVLLVTGTFVNYDYMNFRGFRAFDQAVTHFQLGGAYMASEQLDHALAEYEAAYDISTRYPTHGFNDIADIVDFQIGAIYWEKGLHTRAIDALERVGGPDLEMVRNAKFMLADAYTRRGRASDALVTYGALLQETPSDERARIGYATALRETGDPEAALEIFREILQQSGQYETVAHLETARTLERLQDFQAAEQQYRQAAQGRFVRRDALLSLVRMFVKTNQHAAAGALFSELNQEFPTDPEIQAEIRGYAQRQQ